MVGFLEGQPEVDLFFQYHVLTKLDWTGVEYPKHDQPLLGFYNPLLIELWTYLEMKIDFKHFYET